MPIYTSVNNVLPMVLFTVSNVNMHNIIALNKSPCFLGFFFALSSATLPQNL